jgi:hypothetical protein
MTRAALRTRLGQRDQFSCFGQSLIVAAHALELVLVGLGEHGGREERCVTSGDHVTSNYELANRVRVELTTCIPANGARICRKPLGPGPSNMSCLGAPAPPVIVTP